MSWQAYTTPEYVAWFSRVCYNFALTNMSLTERPFLYDIMSGSLKSWFTNGYCCIRYHFLVRTSLRFGTAGWYCVTKGRIRFFVLFRWRRRGCVLSWNFTSEDLLITKFCVKPLSLRCLLNEPEVRFSSNVLFEEFVLRSLRASPVTKRYKNLLILLTMLS